MQSPTIDREAPHPALQDAPGASARTARYIGRLDPHLESLPGNAARLAFLSRELVTWTALYNQFLNLIDKGHDPDPNGPDVHDYLQTICAISVRKERLGGGQ